MSSAKPSRIKVREHRERLKKQGLRPVQFWVPDVNSVAFQTEAHRQSLLVSSSAGEADDQAFIDSVTVGAGEA